MVKRRTRAQAKAFAEVFTKEKVNGDKALDIASKYGVHYTYVNRLIKELKNGEFKGVEADHEFLKGFDDELPSGLVDVVKEDFDNPQIPVGSVKIEMIEVLVYADDIRDSIKVSVEKPDTSDIEEFENELERRVLKKLNWFHAIKGFKFTNNS